MKEGKWFGDEAMKDRDPWLWYEHVGKVEGEERPAPRGSAEEVSEGAGRSTADLN